VFKLIAQQINLEQWRFVAGEKQIKAVVLTRAHCLQSVVEHK